MIFSFSLYAANFCFSVRPFLSSLYDQEAKLNKSNDKNRFVIPGTLVHRKKKTKKNSTRGYSPLQIQGSRLRRHIRTRIHLQFGGRDERKTK